eukprot:GEMP01048833.1.p1 GENE.GEMP01048833.1~~GEMP01048833.1.p1  ORF type:complete len:252 (+),score=2.50 GEMP01048833.1:47-802(+)
MASSLNYSTRAFRWLLATRLTGKFASPNVQRPYGSRQFGTIRAWSDIGIHDINEFRQNYVTKGEDIFCNSRFNFDMPISKRAEFARSEIGLRAFKQQSKYPLKQTEIDVRTAQIHYDQFHRRFRVYWQGVYWADTKPVLLVGFFPDEVRVWIWDKDIVSASVGGRVRLMGNVDTRWEEFDQSPGQHLVSIRYDDDEAWRKFGLENDFPTTLSQYQTQGELVYAKTCFKGLSIGTQHKLFAEISNRVFSWLA